MESKNQHLTKRNPGRYFGINVTGFDPSIRTLSKVTTTSASVGISSQVKRNLFSDISCTTCT